MRRAAEQVWNIFLDVNFEMKVAQPSLLGNLHCWAILGNRWAIFIGQPSAILGNLRWATFVGQPSAILGNRWAILGNRWAIFIGQSSLGNLGQSSLGNLRWAIFVGQSWAIVGQSSLGNLRCPTGSAADLVGHRQRCGIQCDQMTDYKISLIFSKVGQKVAARVFA